MKTILRLASPVALAALAFASLSYANFWLAKFLVAAAITLCITADS